MDGLDEVSTNIIRDKVQEQLRQVSGEYRNNRFILTCRTQIMGSMPVGFTSVEVADFNQKQVEQFVQNWFKASGQSGARAKEQWETISGAIANKPDLKELAVTPVLLSLMCLVLQDEGEIPSDRAWLYKKGIKLLLSRWNDGKQIDGLEVGTETYRELSIEDKEALLIEIAARKFENPKNFVLFEQEELADQITHRLQLSNRREGVVVLKAIEAQHGLLIERADELWSFSHLTFQEHFTVQWLTQLSSEQLIKTIASRQWQEVVKQLVKSQQPADRLIRLIYKAIEQSIACEPTVQTFWNGYFRSRSPPKQTISLPQFETFTTPLPLPASLTSTSTSTEPLTAPLDLNLDRSLYRDLRERERKRERERERNLNLDLDLNLALDLDLVCALDRALDLTRDLTRDLRDLERDFNRDFNRVHDHVHDPNLTNKLQRLGAKLYRLSNWKDFYQWLQVNGSQWVEELRQVMIAHRNIGHDWQFTD